MEQEFDPFTPKAFIPGAPQQTSGNRLGSNIVNQRLEIEAVHAEMADGALRNHEHAGD